jgi:hypothetical protein
MRRTAPQPAICACGLKSPWFVCPLRQVLFRSAARCDIGAANFGFKLGPQADYLQKIAENICAIFMAKCNNHSMKAESVRTTVDIPGPLDRKVKQQAAAKGCSVRELVPKFGPMLTFWHSLRLRI